MKRIVFIALLLSVSFLLSACNDVPDDVRSVIDNQSSMESTSEELSQIEMVTLSEILNEIETLKGTTYNQIVIPERIFLDKDAVFCSFETKKATNELCDLNTFFERVTGVANDGSVYTCINEPVDFKKNDSEEIIYIYSGEGSLKALNHIESVELQNAERNAAEKSYTLNIKDEETVNLIKSYTDRFNSIISGIDFNGYEYRLCEYGANSVDNSEIDYFDIDVTYGKIPLNRHRFANSTNYLDAPSDLYRDALGKTNQISFVDKKHIGTFGVTAMEKPTNLKEYDKICSLTSALSLVSLKLTDKVMIKLDKIELVYVGETKEFAVNERGKMSPIDENPVFSYHLYWAFTTTEDSAMVTAHDGKSCFLVDALSGEVSTYTELREE